MARASRVIRICAGFDLVVTGLFALPVTAPVFVSTLYALDRALGGPFATPSLGVLGWFFANLAGVLGVLWALVRLLRPEAWLARADALGQRLHQMQRGLIGASRARQNPRCTAIQRCIGHIVTSCLLAAHRVRTHGK